jgi:hypothetical protein
MSGGANNELEGPFGRRSTNKPTALRPLTFDTGHHALLNGLAQVLEIALLSQVKLASVAFDAAGMLQSFRQRDLG